jgi:hypothetical protein
MTIAALAIVVLALVAYCRPKPAPIPRAEQKSLDSLEATKPAFSALRDTLILRETTYVTRSSINRAQAIAATQAADSLRERAIVAQRVAEAARDTSSAWRTVAQLRTAESDSLRSANGALVTALSDMNLARSAAVSRATAAEARLTASENLNARLAEDVRAGDRCRILYIAACPSRKTAAISGVILGAAVVALIDRRP